MFACDEKVVVEHPLTQLDAIRIFQIHEKTRQGKLRAQYLRDLRYHHQLSLNVSNKPVEVDENVNEKQVLNSAALRIQRLFRGYKARKEYLRLQDENYVFLGMKSPVKQNESPTEKRDKNFARRKIIQGVFNEEYLQSLINTKEK